MILLELTNLFAFIIYGVAAIGVVAFMIGFSHVLGERHEARFRNEPFESGMPVTGDARMKFSSHFYMVAMFFVIFDLDAAFIVTYAIAFREVGWAGYIGLAVFIAILVAVLIYEWKIGALDFGPDGKKIIKAQPQSTITEESLK
jgi:NADH-quinone oxidoreductase subunit A